MKILIIVLLSCSVLVLGQAQKKERVHAVQLSQTKECQLLINSILPSLMNKKFNDILPQIVDGQTEGFALVDRESTLDVIKKKRVNSEEEFWDRAFRFHKLLNKNSKISLTRLKETKENVNILKTDMKTIEGKGTLYIFEASNNLWEGHELITVKFVKYKNKFYWLPFKW